MFDNLYVVLILLFLTIFIFSSLPKIFKSPYLFFFKNIFASWKLFDVSDYKLIVKYKVSNKVTNNNEKFDELNWTEFQNKTSLSLSSILFNPKGNLMLYYKSNLLSLANELSEIEESGNSESLTIQENISYNILLKYVQKRIIDESKENSYISGINSLEDLRYVFKIVSIDSKNKIEEDILISPAYNINLL